MAPSTTNKKPSRPLTQNDSHTGAKRTQAAAQDQTNIPEIDLAQRKNVLDLLKIPGISGQEEQVAEFIRKKLLDAGCSKNFISFDQRTKKHLSKVTVET